MLLNVWTNSVKETSTC